MRKPVANAIKNLVKKACEDRNIPFRKSMYRRAKSVYYQIPWHRRHLVGLEND